MPVLAVSNRGTTSAGVGDAASAVGGNALENGEIGSFINALLALAAPDATAAEAVDATGENASTAPPAALAAQVVPGADLPPPRQALPGSGSALPPTRQAPMPGPVSWSGTAARRVLGEASGIAPTPDTGAAALDMAAPRDPMETAAFGKLPLSSAAVGPATAGDVDGDVVAMLAAAGVAAGNETPAGGASNAVSAVLGSAPRVGEHLASTPAQAYGEATGSLPVRDAGLFAERLNQHVAVMLSQHVQHARLAVNPPELGPVEVRVTVTGDEANVQLVATHAATREALEEALPRLRAAFQEGGVALGQAAVFSEMPERQGAARQGSDGRPATAAHALAGADEEASPVAQRVQVGLIDAFV